MNDLPLVSVVIPTLNSEKTLQKCLKSVFDQTYANIEVTVVDAGSDDKTVEIAKGFGVKVINANIRNMAKQTNIGASSSNGKYVYRLDSDVILTSTVVEECVEKCENDNCDAVATYWGPDPSLSFWAKVRKLEKDCYKYDSKRNVARFYKKIVFDNIGGYNEGLESGEDYDVQNKIIVRGYNFCFAKSEGLHLGEPISIVQIAKKNFNYGMTVSKFLKNNKTKGVQQMSPVRLSLFQNWKKFIINPLETIGFLFYYFVIYISTLLGLFYSFLRPIKG